MPFLRCSHEIGVSLSSTFAQWQSNICASKNFVTEQLSKYWQTVFISQGLETKVFVDLRIEINEFYFRLLLKSRTHASSCPSVVSAFSSFLSPPPPLLHLGPPLLSVDHDPLTRVVVLLTGHDTVPQPKIRVPDSFLSLNLSDFSGRQRISRVGTRVRDPTFVHGQLHVAPSRPRPWCGSLTRVSV